MRSIVEEEPTAKKKYMDKLNRIHEEKSIPIGDINAFRKRYGLE